MPPETAQRPPPGPVRERAQQFVLDLVNGPAYSAGDRIPSERDLSLRSGVSRVTMRKAIAQLVERGVLERRGRSGTYLTAPVITRPISGAMFSRGISKIVRAQGGEPGSRLLVFERHAADPRVAERLLIGTGDPVIVIRRLRSVGDLPFCVETTHLASARVPGLVADDLLGRESFYDLLGSRYSITMGGGTGTISASGASGMESELLGLRRDATVLLYQAVAFDDGGRPMEYLNSVNHPQRVVFRMS